MIPTIARRLRIALLTAAFAGLIGCNSGEHPFPVRGQLLYEDTGKPIQELAGFTVTFTSEQLGKSASGNIDEEGRFQLTSLNNHDGAFPGVYQVMVTQPRFHAERGERRKPVVDLVYENPQLSGLTAAVQPQENTFTFKLRRIEN